METLSAADTSYVLQMGLEELHAQAEEYWSLTQFWSDEFKFFQDLLDKNVLQLQKEDQLKTIEQLQNKLIYYRDELLEQYAHDVRVHRDTLDKLMRNKKGVDDQQYLDEHRKLTENLRNFQKEVRPFKQEVFGFVSGLKK